MRHERLGRGLCPECGGEPDAPPDPMRPTTAHCIDCDHYFMHYVGV